MEKRYCVSAVITTERSKEWIDSIGLVLFARLRDPDNCVLYRTTEGDIVTVTVKQAPLPNPSVLCKYTLSTTSRDIVDSIRDASELLGISTRATCKNGGPICMRMHISTSPDKGPSIYKCLTTLGVPSESIAELPYHPTSVNTPNGKILIKVSNCISGHDVEISTEHMETAECIYAKACESESSMITVMEYVEVIPSQILFCRNIPITLFEGLYQIGAQDKGNCLIHIRTEDLLYSVDECIEWLLGTKCLVVGDSAYRTIDGGAVNTYVVSGYSSYVWSYDREFFTFSAKRQREKYVTILTADDSVIAASARAKQEEFPDNIVIEQMRLPKKK